MTAQKLQTRNALASIRILKQGLTLLGLVCLTLLPASHNAYSAPNDNAVALIDKLGREAVNTLTNDKAEQNQIQSQFLTLLHRDFDVNKIAQFVLGRYWRTANESQRDQFTKLFIDRLKIAYANRFKEYKGVKFTTKTQRNEKDYAIVSSTLQKPSGPEVDVDWWVKENKIHDVVVDGVSMRTTLRDDYYELVNQHSGDLDKFLKDLENRA